jgi:hypothetical protein
MAGLSDASEITMQERDEGGQRVPRQRSHSWLGTHLPLETETSRYVLVSALDVFLTYLLIRQPHFTEANPLALYFINHWGVKGMVWFKFGLVAFVCVLSQAIARHKPEAACRLLNFATLVVGAVVAYSVMLYLRHG